MNYMKQIAKYLSFVLLVFMLSVAGCKKENYNNIATCLKLSADTLAVHGDEEVTLTIRNDGSDTWDYRFHSAYSDIYCNDYPGDLEPGEEGTFRFSCQRDRGDVEVHRYELIITSNLGYVVIHFISIPENIENQCYVNKKIYFPNGASSFKFPIDNCGSTAITYSITSSSGKVELPLPSGRILPYGRAEIEVKVNDLSFWQGNNSAELYVNSGNVIDTVRVFMEKKIMIDGNVTDAAYSGSLDKLVYLTDKSTLVIFDPITKTHDVIRLTRSGYPLALSPDGTKALVGYGNGVALIDLQNQYVITEVEWDVQYPIESIALGSDDWAYLGCEDGLYCADLNSFNLELSPTIWTTSKLFIHPSGNYLYDMMHSRIYKYAVHDGEMNFMQHFELDDYDEYMLGFSKEGDKLFTSNGSIYQVSDHPEDNLELIGKAEIGFDEEDYALYHSYELSCMNYNDLNHMLYMVEYFDDYYYYHQYPCVYVSNLDDLQPVENIYTEPSLTVDASGLVSMTWDWKPAYAFVSADGSTIYLLSVRYFDLPIEEWALEIIPL